MSDAISRADAIKIVQNRCKRYTTACVLAVTEIRNLPPIQPKRGRWEQKDFKYHCSCCDGIAPKAIRWDFCPNCGADMRGQQDG